MSSLTELKQELNQWFQWCISEEDTLNRATDEYLIELLKVRLKSGYQMLLNCEQEYLSLKAYIEDNDKESNLEVSPAALG